MLIMFMDDTAEGSVHLYSDAMLIMFMAGTADGSVHLYSDVMFITFIAVQRVVQQRAVFISTVTQYL